ncbi:hypothetical protein [Leifsonia poae]|uniref:hypothetical protein n=1 Tax=Leifsonia poae TaxID=110933 RepID=UPI003D672EAE
MTRMPATSRHIPGRQDLGLAGVAVPAHGEARIAPLHGADVGQVLSHDPEQSGASLAVHRCDVDEPVLAHAAVTEQQLDRVVGRDSQSLELLGVCGELEQGGDARTPREFRILNPEPAVGTAHDEVGEPDERAVEERGLEDHLGAAVERRLRLGDRRGQRVRIKPFGAFDLDDPGTELLLVALQDAPLVLVAQPRAAHVQRIFDLFGRLDAPEFHVKRSEKCEFALGRRGQIARTRDDDPVEQEHAALRSSASVSSVPAADDTAPSGSTVSRLWRPP